jgi:hypothetical protein
MLWSMAKGEGGAEKVRENRLRAAAARQGLTLSRSRRRDTMALTYGTYMLLSETTREVVAGDVESGQGYGLSLDEVEKFLTTPRDKT